MQIDTRGLPEGKGTGREGQNGDNEQSCFFGLRRWAGELLLTVFSLVSEVTPRLPRWLPPITHSLSLKD